VDTTAYAAQKAAAIRAYRSQFEVNEKNRKVVEWVAAEDLYFGSRMGTAAAEPFFTHEPIGLTGLAGLSL
jgi:LmbE family N-acetylglucosaminyl deacetylase